MRHLERERHVDLGLVDDDRAEDLRPNTRTAGGRWCGMSRTKKEPAPAATGSRPSPNTTTAKDTRYRRQDGYQASVEDRAEEQLLAEAKALGYRLATRCLDCGHWLVNERSVRAHRGPRCAAKAGDAT